MASPSIVRGSVDDCESLSLGAVSDPSTTSPSTTSAPALGGAGAVKVVTLNRSLRYSIVRFLYQFRQRGTNKEIPIVSVINPGATSKPPASKTSIPSVINSPGISFTFNRFWIRNLTLFHCRFASQAPNSPVPMMIITVAQVGMDLLIINSRIRSASGTKVNSRKKRTNTVAFWVFWPEHKRKKCGRSIAQSAALYLIQ